MNTKMKNHSKIVLWAVLLILTLILGSCVPIDMEKVFSEKHGTVSDDPVIEQFDANPPGAMEGDTSTLRWRTRNTTSVRVSGIGNVPLNGERQVAPGNTYILTATGPGGQSVSEERFIAVYQPQVIGEKPVIEKFEAHPPHVTQGGTTTLHWRTRNSASVKISGIGEVPPSGSRVIIVGKEGSYVLTVTGHDGSSINQPIHVGQYALKGKAPDVQSSENKIPKKPVLQAPQLKIDSPKINSGPVVKPLMPARTLSIKALSPPAQRSPVHGKRFSHYPRRTTLEWAPVEGASSYTVEIDCYGCCQAGRWCTDVGRTYKQVQSIRATAYTFDFAGAQPGRWRVWAIDKNGNPGQKSPWWTFHFTR